MLDKDNKQDFTLKELCVEKANQLIDTFMTDITLISYLIPRGIALGRNTNSVGVRVLGDTDTVDVYCSTDLADIEGTLSFSRNTGELVHVNIVGDDSIDFGIVMDEVFNAFTDIIDDAKKDTFSSVNSIIVQSLGSQLKTLRTHVKFNNNGYNCRVTYLYEYEQLFIAIEPEIIDVNNREFIFDDGWDLMIDITRNVNADMDTFNNAMNAVYTMLIDLVR